MKALEAKWEWTPVVDEESDKEIMKILGMSKDKFRELCSKLTINQIIIMFGDEISEILKLKKL